MSRRYQCRYKTKLAEIEHKEASILLGLEKLEQGGKDVEDMKLVLAEEDKKLAVASEETNKMLEGLQISSAEAQREGDKVAKDKAACEADAERIGKEKALAEIDLAKAQPFVDKVRPRRPVRCLHSMRLVSISRGRGWFLFRIRGRSDRGERPRCSAQATHEARPGEAPIQ